MLSLMPGLGIQQDQVWEKAALQIATFAWSFCCDTMLRRNYCVTQCEAFCSRYDCWEQQSHSASLRIYLPCTVGRARLWCAVVWCASINCETYILTVLHIWNLSIILVFLVNLVVFWFGCWGLAVAGSLCIIACRMHPYGFVQLYICKLCDL